ncbi:MAG: 2-oxo acid dehydrogenase subunit E2 [Deltaproteobacteria bacterium]|nr:2-oxo acid dehydrogenase subunit E2 [Deltaproteobacteria bacterium]
MVSDISVPKLGMSEEDITVIEFCVEDGQSIKKDDLAVIIETAKVSHEVFSPTDGLLFHVKKVQDKVSIGSLLAAVADSREEFETYKETIPEEVEIAPDQADIASETAEGSTDEPGPLPEGEVGEINGLSVLKRIPYVGMRRTIANNLHKSLQVGAQLTIVSEADMTALSDYRAELMLDYPDTKITYVDLIVKIIPAALKAYPIVNSAIYQDEIICWDQYNIGVAISLDEGLVVPVIRDADKKSLVQISRKIKSLAKKARNGQLSSEDLSGGTFTFSSGGKVETDIITPIIKPPESAILAIGKIGPKPAVFQDQLAIRTMTNLCLTHDHRVVDGVPASMFLGRLKQIIETPALFRDILK